MRTTMTLCGILCVSFVLMGCWDQRLLKDSCLILGIGIDLTKNKQIEQTFLYPRSIKGQNPHQETLSASAIGDTSRNAKAHADQKIADRFDASKNRFFLFGKDLAQQGIYSTLDVIYRDAKGPSNAKIAIVNGRAKDALSLRIKETSLSSEYYPKLLHSAEEVGLIQNQTVQSVCSIMFAEGKDFMVPYLDLLKSEKRTYLTVLAMFHHDKLVGRLGIKESRIFLLLNGRKSKHQSLTLRVSNKELIRDKNFINIEILQVKTTPTIFVTNGKVKINLNINFKLGINEYANDHFRNKKNIRKLNQRITKELTHLANQTISKMQEANCDGLGIGQRLQAYHPTLWKNINWETKYPNVPIAVHIDNEIIHHGIID
ncbi:Ger(x)C family spore germination protein [Bacillus thuringiensis]